MIKTSLRAQLYKMLIGLLVISVVSIGTVVCCISYRNVMDLAVMTSEELAAKTADELRTLLDGMRSIPVVIGRDSRIQNAIRQEDLTQAEQDQIEDEISTFLAEMNQYDSDLSAIYFFAENGVFAQSQFYRPKVADLQSNPLYEEACRQGRTVWCPPQNGSSVAVTTHSERIIATVTPVKDVRSGDYAGMIVVEMTEKKLAEYLNVDVGKRGFLYICDEEQTPIVTSSGMTPEDVTAYLGAASWGSSVLGGGLTVRLQINNSGWFVISMVARADLMENVYNIIVMTVAVCLLLLALAVFATVRVTGVPLRRIDCLNRKMRQVAEGDLSVRVEIDQYDELGVLMEHFNQMVEHTEALVRREAENQAQLRAAEFKALQAQIKPHFLYNTLDSIIWLARANDQEGVVNMVGALTDFLKTGLSKGDEIIPLEQEIHHTASYLRIQEMRYRGKFIYTITLEERARAYPVPKLIVQPLVENAIYHGMKLKRETCNLSIWAGERDGCLIIEVCDDGVGMEPVVEARLRTAIANHETGSGGYGVVNVNERVQIMSGEQYGISFKTCFGEGSVFRITLPKQEEDRP